MIRMQRYALFLTILSGLLIAAVACTEVSPAIGRYYEGRTLMVSVLEEKRGSELRYAFTNADQVEQHYRITASSDDLELVMFKISVQNHRATSAIVNVDEQAAELTDYARGKYFPLNVINAAEKVSAPSNPSDEQSIEFLWNRTLVDDTSEAFDLKQGFKIDGWMLFEVPKDLRFREFRWRAGDSLTIPFWPG